MHNKWMNEWTLYTETGDLVKYPDKVIFFIVQIYKERHHDNISSQNSFEHTISKNYCVKYSQREKRLQGSFSE
jgi:hypothetical protein